MCIGPFKQVARASGDAAANFGMGHTAAVEEPQSVPVASTRPLAPETPGPSGAATYPESWAYRLKNRLLGPPMVSEQLSQERLATPVAIGVLAPDMISSSAYGTEEMLVIMVPIIGLAAFSMVIPITVAILAVMIFVMISYIQVIGVYTRSGGSYVVARDNFGPNVAQVAAVALLIDYTVTVAVQTSAGTAALTSAFPTLVPYTIAITVGVTLIMLFGNLRGIREAGSIFAIPTYFYVVSLSLVVITGLVKAALGGLHAHALPSAAALGYPIGNQRGFLMGLGIFYCLRAFANGGSSLTGMEAVSNGISSFRRPEARNGRIALLVMCGILGFLVLGTSLLAHWTHAVPYLSGSPTVVSQEVRYVLGSSWLGNGLFYLVQAATVLILFTGGNTSFNGFPYLASFVAGDSFLPRQLTKRGHRLAFSNGIFVLAAVAILLIIVFKAQLNALVGLYAIGVFTGFSFAGFGMLKHHLTCRERRWRIGAVINGFAGGLSVAVVVILMVTKFFEGAWIVIVVGPPLYYGLIRLHRQYVAEEKQLETGAVAAAEAPVLQRHVVLVLVGQLDMAAARAVQYARTLRPDEVRVVHFNIDAAATEQLKEEWSRLGLAHLPLDILECRDRRLERAALEYVADIVADGKTECTVLLPRRAFHSRLARVLHDRTADRIADAVGGVAHVAATIVPFNLEAARRRRFRAHPDRPDPVRRKPTRGTGVDRELARRATGTIPIGDVTWRTRVRVAGRIRSLRVQTAKGTANLECEITDDTGILLLVFQGRPKIPGIEPGARLIVEGMVGSWQRRLAILNPDYELVSE
ncbi:MAG: amino acid permease [Candidatus Dormibacteria bacterium]